MLMSEETKCFLMNKDAVGKGEVRVSAQLL